MIGLLGAIPLLWRIGIGLAIVAALGVGYGVWHHRVYESGYAAAIAAVARADQDAIDRVAAGVKELVECRVRGGTWDVVTGTCK